MMKIFSKISDIKLDIQKLKGSGASIGFVPTMGALHKGHITLVKKCVAENDYCFVSVFVNPTQFNNKTDLELYPRTPEADCKLLEEAGCYGIFMPKVEEMYPKADNRVFSLGECAEVMEGRFRPGHFNGVAQIVSKLFYAVEPHNAYFGEKDFQQIAVIRSMAREIESDVNIIAVPTVREVDGLALSSRNVRLSEEQRKNAPKIWETLSKSCTFVTSKSVKDTIAFVISTIDLIPDMQVEYFEIVNGDTLMAIENWDDAQYVVGCITVYCGDVRLIDNITYKRI